MWCDLSKLVREGQKEVTDANASFFGILETNMVHQEKNAGKYIFTNINCSHLASTIIQTQMYA